MIIWKEPLEFEWDAGNIYKNKKHNVFNEEIESVFFDDNKQIKFDKKHSLHEPRYIVVGKNKSNKYMYLVVTERAGKIRVISGRYMHKKEVELYEKSFKSTKI